jgi:hypothetical protein
MLKACCQRVGHALWHKAVEAGLLSACKPARCAGRDYGRRRAEGRCPFRITRVSLTTTARLGESLPFLKRPRSSLRTDWHRRSSASSSCSRKTARFRSPVRGANLGKFQHALVGQFDLARVTARETDLLEGHENGNDQFGRQRHRNVLIRRLSQDRAGRARSNIQRATRSVCAAGEAIC